MEFGFPERPGGGNNSTRWKILSNHGQYSGLEANEID
jgi:hypothetical protein